MDLVDPGSASSPLGLFCARLRRLQTESGIRQADLLGAAGRKKSQVSDILNGKIERPPDWGVTIAIVHACLEHARPPSALVPPDLIDEADWQRRYFDLEQDLDTAARTRRRRDESAGRPLAEVTDPFTLEVHHPVQPDAPQRDLPVLPEYVAREHDAQLGGCRGGRGRPQRDRGTGGRVVHWEDPGVLGSAGAAARAAQAVAVVASDRPVPPGGGAAGAAFDRPADRSVAERGAVLP